METVDDLDSMIADAPDGDAGICIQQGSYLLELSLDWIVLRASENIHHLLRESHVTLIDEPLGKFVHSQALHDLRNLFARLSGTTGIGRAYAVRLTDDHDLVDIAFQLTAGRVLLEAVPSSGCFGESFGSVGGLIAGLANSSGQPLLDGAARRMRALTGYDRVTLICGKGHAESSRGMFAGRADPSHLPVLVADTEANGVAIFPRPGDDARAASALLRSLTNDDRRRLQIEGVRAALRVPFTSNGETAEFYCESRTERRPNFEVHAAAELFAQMFSMRLEADEAAD